MQLGLVLPHTGARAKPGLIRACALAAEEAGFATVWAVDHLVMPHHTDSPYVLGRRPAPVADGGVSALMSPNYELLTTLTWVAGFTSRIGVGTSVAVLSIRNIIATARQVATLDVLSGGRVTFGAGVGWLREEAEILGMPWDRRGARFEEAVALLRTLWDAEGELVEFHGEFHEVPPMDPEPRPHQRRLPVLVGGHSDTAVARAGRIGDGWITAPMSAERVGEHWGRVRAAAEAAGRDATTLHCVASLAPGTPVEPDLLRGYAAAGVDQLQLRVFGDGETPTVAEIQRIGREFVPLAAEL